MKIEIVKLLVNQRGICESIIHIGRERVNTWRLFYAEDTNEEIE